VVLLYIVKKGDKTMNKQEFMIKYIEILKQFWLYFPEWRFAQLVSNLYDTGERPLDIFYKPIEQSLRTMIYLMENYDPALVQRIQKFMIDGKELFDEF
jgi:hypothetical protein